MPPRRVVADPFRTRRVRTARPPKRLAGGDTTANDEIDRRNLRSMRAAARAAAFPSAAEAQARIEEELRGEWSVDAIARVWTHGPESIRALAAYIAGDNGLGEEPALRLWATLQDAQAELRLSRCKASGNAALPSLDSLEDDGDKLAVKLLRTLPPPPAPFDAEDAPEYETEEGECTLVPLRVAALSVPLARLVDGMLRAPVRWAVGDARRQRLLATLRDRFPSFAATVTVQQAKSDSFEVPITPNDAHTVEVVSRVVDFYDAELFLGEIRRTREALRVTEDGEKEAAHAAMAYLSSYGSEGEQDILLAPCATLLRDWRLVLGDTWWARDTHPSVRYLRSDFLTYLVLVAEHELAHLLARWWAQAHRKRYRQGHNRAFWTVFAAYSGHDWASLVAAKRFGPMTMTALSPAWAGARPDRLALQRRLRAEVSVAVADLHSGDGFAEEWEDAVFNAGAALLEPGFESRELTEKDLGLDGDDDAAPRD
jgi:hypothetical protein